ncbi:MAG: GDP-mannose mannosyl hydrolase [Burkholderiales bacterium]
MSNSAYLPREIFATVVRHTPLVSIDLVVRDASGRMLVGWGRNRPARESWFVPGARIAKDESLDAAFRRISHAELGRVIERVNSRFLGVFEHLYDDNFSADASFGTHYVVLAHELKIASAADLPLPRDQHAEYVWLTDAEALARVDVHPNTRAYCSL